MWYDSVCLFFNYCNDGNANEMIKKREIQIDRKIEAVAVRTESRTRSG